MLFTHDYWAPTMEVGLYRPLVTTSYALNYAFAERSPRGYHLTNIAMHGLVSVLVWALYMRLTADPCVAAAAGLLFAAHAAHTEVVANVAGRAELLGALFFLISLLLVLRYRDTPRGGLYALCLGSYLLALLSKESTVTLVGVIFLYDCVYGRERDPGLVARLRGALRRGWPLYAGYVLVTLVYLGIRAMALGADAALPHPAALDNPLVSLDLPWRILNALQVAFHYLWLLCFPLQLSYDYSYNAIPLIGSLVDPHAWGVLALCTVTVAVVVWSYRSGRELFFALGFYFITFSVVSNLLVLIGTIMGERLVYVPSVGFCLALVLALRGLCRRIPLAPGVAQTVFVTVCALIVALHGLRTLDRNPDWSRTEQLYLHDVEIVPDSAKALNNAGKVHQDQGRHAQALQEFARALEIEPTYRMPVINQAYSLSSLGRVDEAMALLDGEIRRGSREPFVYNNLGYLLVESEIDLARGVALLEKANELKPNDPDILDSLGWAYFRQGRLDDAYSLLARSLRINDWSPSSPSRRAHLAALERALGRNR